MAYTNIDDPSAFFQTLTYTASTATPSQTFTNDGNSDLKPDFLWIKNRSGWGNRDHALFDSSRGVNKRIRSNNTNSEDTMSYQTFNTNGFTVPESFETAYSGPYVAWQWKCNGGTTASNSDGNITSTVQVNQDAGFSIVTWTGNEQSSASVGHGLGVKPDMVFFKRRNATYSWVVYMGPMGVVGGNNMFAYLNVTNAAEQGAGITFTSSLLGPGNGATTNSGAMVAYCFNSVQGYSKFGKYEGNSNANGPFIYTGFKPAFIMIKPADINEHWVMHDIKRDEYNGAGTPYVFANEAEPETASYERLDFLSNGFKIRVGGNNWNPSSTVVYMAFAENPFVTSTGIMGTAR